jgi:hypothetical protein
MNPSPKAVWQVSPLPIRGVQDSNNKEGSKVLNKDVVRYQERKGIGWIT